MSSQIRASRSSTRILFPPISLTPPENERFATAASGPRSIRELHHDHVPNRLHRPEAEDQPSLGICLEEARLDRLRRRNEERLDPARLRFEEEVRQDPEDLSVLRHDGLATEFCRKNLHSRRGAYPRVLIFPFWPRRP